MGNYFAYFFIILQCLALNCVVSQSDPVVSTLLEQLPQDNGYLLKLENSIALKWAQNLSKPSDLYANSIEVCFNVVGTFI
jgi:hypothetical protein